MSKKHQRGEGEALGHGDRGEPGVAQGEDLALLGGDVDLLDRLGARPVGDLEQRRRGPRASDPVLGARGEDTARPASKIAAPRRSGDISTR